TPPAVGLGYHRGLGGPVGGAGAIRPGTRRARYLTEGTPRTGWGTVASFPLQAWGRPKGPERRRVTQLLSGFRPAHRERGQQLSGCGAQLTGRPVGQFLHAALLREGPGAPGAPGLQTDLAPLRSLDRLAGDEG